VLTPLTEQERAQHKPTAGKGWRATLGGKCGNRFFTAFAGPSRPDRAMRLLYAIYIAGFLVSRARTTRGFDPVP